MSKGRRLPLLRPIHSVTHAHLILASASELTERNLQGRIRMLDVGCGNGQLLLAFARYLPALTGKTLDPLGLEVSDSAVQRPGFFAETEQRLRAGAPEYDWQQRLFFGRSTDEWPVEDDSIDLLVTNHVLEHVENLHRFFAETKRVLRPNGVSLHLFPTSASVVEGHLWAPWAHRIRSSDIRRAYLTKYARTGLARKGPLRTNAMMTPAEWGQSRSDYLQNATWYRTWSTLADAAKAAHLQASYRWTPDFYALKLAYILNAPELVMYGHRPSAKLSEALLFRLLERVASVSMCFENGKAYEPDHTPGGHN